MAIDEYSKGIKNDSLVAQDYYFRGLMFLVKNDYKSALSDFFNAAYVQYIQLDSEKIENIKSEKYDAYVQDLIQSVENKDTVNIKRYLGNIELIDDFESYQERIKFCIDKIKNHEETFQ